MFECVEASFSFKFFWDFIPQRTKEKDNFANFMKWLLKCMAAIS